MGVNVVIAGLVIAMIADALLIGSSYYLYKREERTRYLVAIFMGGILLVLLMMTFAYVYLSPSRA